MKKKIGSALILAALILATSFNTAWALSLDQGKAKGLVGEQQNGYLGAVANTDAEVNALVASINQQRRAKYQEIAQKNGTSLSAVEALAAKKALEETAAGNFIQNAAGAWIKK